MPARLIKDMRQVWGMREDWGAPISVPIHRGAVEEDLLPVQGTRGYCFHPVKASLEMDPSTQ